MGLNMVFQSVVMEFSSNPHLVLIKDHRGLVVLPSRGFLALPFKEHSVVIMFFVYSSPRFSIESIDREAMKDYKLKLVA